MLFHHKNAQYLGERLSEMLEAPQGSVDVKECFKVAGQLVSARENSQKCASEAAPYCHPKLAAIAVQHSDAPERTEVDIDNASPEQLENAWAQELLG